MPLKFKPVEKDRLFYNRWEYCMSLRLEEATALRTLSHEYIDETIRRRQEWREISRYRLANTKVGITLPPYFKEIYQEINTITVENLHRFAQAVIDSSIDYKIVTSGHRVWLYTNNPALFLNIKGLPGVTNTKYTQAIVTRNTNTILLANPKYTLRSYLRSIKLNETDKDLITNFLTNQQNLVKLSPSLQQWLTDPFYRLQDYYFIDHDELWLTMMALVRPGLIRKTVKIAAR